MKPSNNTLSKYSLVIHRCFAVAIGLTLSTLTHAQEAATPENLPVTLQNIAGQWSCLSINTNSMATEKINYDVSSFLTYQTNISTQGIETTPEMTMSIRFKDIEEAFTYQIKSNMIGAYSFDNGQLWAQALSSNFTDVQQISGEQLASPEEIKQTLRESIEQDIQEQTKLAISTTILTPTQWQFLIESEQTLTHCTRL